MYLWFKQNITILVLSCLVGLIPTVSIFFAISQDFKTDILGLQRIQIHRINVLTDDIRATLRNLNEANYDACSQSALIHMRKEVFSNLNFSDIGYYTNNNTLLCSGTLGILPKPYVSGPPTLITPDHFNIWANTEIAIDPNYRTAVVGYGHYNVVISPDFKRFKDTFGVRWELYHHSKNATTHLLGVEGLFEKKFGSTLWLSHTLSTCSDQNRFCIVSDYQLADYIHQYRLTMLIALFSGIFFTIYTFNRLRHRKKYQVMPEYRVMQGLENKKFHTLYQPIINMQTNQIIGCEVLARFEDARGPIYPDVFIPLIAKNNKTWEFTESICKHALKELSELTEITNLNDKFHVNVNFFARDIDSGQILNLQNCIYRHGFQLVIEVTEDEKLASQEAIAHLEKLVQLGFQVAIDDFGTGYSNLNSLKQSHCDILKIDRSFTNQIEGGAIRSTLVPHIVDIANNLNLSIVAEGVENQAQHNNLKRLGVQYGQGYLYGKPMSASQLRERIAAQMK